MGTVEVDGRGRVTIPKELRERLKLAPGDELEVAVDEDGLRLRVKRPPLALARRGEEWGDEAFLDAGEALFGDDQDSD